ncbi:MAG: magnesium transporter MgtE N-terminal domain-containing protein [Synergistales bacterium]
MQDSPDAAPLKPEPAGGKRPVLFALKVAGVLLLLGGGVLGGLYAGGGIFPLLDRFVPWVERVPGLGHRVSHLLRKIPGPADAIQRRSLELEESESDLEAREKALEEEKARLEGQKKALAPQKTEAKAAATPPEEPASADQAGAEVLRADMLESTLSEMAPSKAARILALMDAAEIGPVFCRMDPDWRAQVLGKMPPKEAARLLRYLNEARFSSAGVPASPESREE